MEFDVVGNVGLQRLGLNVRQFFAALSLPAVQHEESGDMSRENLVRR